MLGDLVGRYVAGELVFARQQPVRPGRDLRHLDEPQRADRRAAAPILVVRVHASAMLSGRYSRTLYGPGADRLAGVVEPACGLVEGAAG